MTERIEYNTVLEVTDYEEEIHLLTNIKYTVIVIDPGYPIRNTTHSTRLLLCETNIRHC